MAAQKTILIAFPGTRKVTDLHRVRNFGEDLWRKIEQTGLGSVGGLETVDCATDRIQVTIAHTRKIGTVRKLVGKLLKHHFPDLDPTVTYG